MPANASCGNTGIFINGRQIHPVVQQRLAALVGPVPPWRYWCDAQGNCGQEGGPAHVNLYQVARQRGTGQGGGRDWSYCSPGVGGSYGNSISGASDGQTTCPDGVHGQSVRPL